MLSEQLENACQTFLVIFVFPNQKNKSESRRGYLLVEYAELFEILEIWLLRDQPFELVVELTDVDEQWSLSQLLLLLLLSS